MAFRERVGQVMPAPKMRPLTPGQRLDAARALLDKASVILQLYQEEAPSRHALRRTQPLRFREPEDQQEFTGLVDAFGAVKASMDADWQEQLRASRKRGEPEVDGLRKLASSQLWQEKAGAMLARAESMLALLQLHKINGFSLAWQMAVTDFNESAYRFCDKVLGAKPLHARFLG